MTFKRVIEKSDHGVIESRYRHGETLQQIGDDLGVSRERIRQIVTKLGCSAESGGASMRKFANAAHKLKSVKSEIRCIKSYGCSIEALLQINGGEKASVKGSPADRYKQQKTTAKTRGIGWEFTLPEWWDVWQASGKWEMRGRGNGYVMSRIGDTGPYHRDNVEIKTQPENMSDYYLYKKPRVERAAKLKSPDKKIVCIRGHNRTPDNLTKNGNCRICQKAASARAYLKKKAA